MKTCRKTNKIHLKCLKCRLLLKEKLQVLVHLTVFPSIFLLSKTNQMKNISDNSKKK